MPRTHTSTFKVRYYECDGYGHLNNANYLRYMQEAAFNASAEAGCDFERYAEIGYHWLIRATDLEYLRPLVYGDVVKVSTWVSDFRRITSRRAYEFRLEGSDKLVARAHTDWVFLDTKSQQPASIPREMEQAFFPEGLPESFSPRDPFPKSPPPPPGVFEMHRKVAWHDLDAEQHVNNAVYLEYIEECGMQVIAAHGWPYQRMNEAGFAVLIRKNQIQYLQPAYLDNELTIRTWASGVKRSTATRHYTIHRCRDNTLLARVHSLGVWVDLQSGRPIRIPEEFIKDFEENIV